MRTRLHLGKGHADILTALFEFEYLTAAQVTKLCYSAGSLKYVKAQLKALVDTGLALSLGGRGTHLPLIYTLTGKGRSRAASLLGQQAKRFRPQEARETQASLYFMHHLLAVNDVLIGARLLAKTSPAIMLTRMYREPELRRSIYVDVPQKICIEPDGSCQFLITEQGHDAIHTWEQFFHLEVYRNLPPVKDRFKQKIQGYVRYDDTEQHEALFHTPVLTVAIFAQTEQMAAILKYWTEQALADIDRSAEGDWFFFRGIDTATASPEEMYLAPVWEHAFGTTKTPLLVLE